MFSKHLKKIYNAPSEFYPKALRDTEVEKKREWKKSYRYIKYIVYIFSQTFEFIDGKYIHINWILYWMLSRVLFNKHGCRLYHIHNVNQQIKLNIQISTISEQLHSMKAMAYLYSYLFTHITEMFMSMYFTLHKEFICNVFLKHFEINYEIVARSRFHEISSKQLLPHQTKQNTHMS